MTIDSCVGGVLVIIDGTTSKVNVVSTSSQYGKRYHLEGDGKKFVVCRYPKHSPYLF